MSDEETKPEKKKPRKPDLLEKGAIIQRDGETYAVTPRIPCGVITDFSLLRRIADAAEKHGAHTIKVTSAQRLAVIGLAESTLDDFWKDVGMTPGIASGLCIRGIKACPGTSCCRLGQQDSLSLGLAIEKRFANAPVPNKLKIAVSGCPLDCAEAQVRDIGVIGAKPGYTVYVGGNVGARPRLAQVLQERVAPDEIEALVDRIIETYRDLGIKKRLGAVIESLGLDAFREKLQ